MLIAFSIAPADAEPDGSVSAAVADAIRIVRASGLPNETNAMFTNLEGAKRTLWHMRGSTCS
jgi:uncharacterized protein YqgV (UPF0045/DUF77 family)